MKGVQQNEINGHDAQLRSRSSFGRLVMAEFEEANVITAQMINLSHLIWIYRSGRRFKVVTTLARVGHRNLIKGVLFH
jgi:hypothetical protein